jgi:hypothetical protein
MNIKHKTCDIRIWGKKTFISDISSNHIETHVPSLYQCVETRSTEVFWLLSQPLPHLRFNLFVISEKFATQLWTALRDKHFLPQTGNISLWIYFTVSPFSTKKKHNRMLLFGSILSSTVTILTTEASLWTCAEHLLLRLSRSWTALPPSDTHRKPITSVTAVLLPSVTCLLILPRIITMQGWPSRT